MVEANNKFNYTICASILFTDKKTSYPASVPQWFKTDRIPSEHTTSVNNFIANSFNGETLKYSSACIKYDRHGYKSRDRFILLSNKAIYVLDGKSYKQKHRLPLEKLDFDLTNHGDDLMVIRIPLDLKKDKGDLILVIPYIIEFCTYIIDTVGTADVLKIVEKES